MSKPVNRFEMPTWDSAGWTIADIAIRQQSKPTDKEMGRLD